MKLSPSELLLNLKQFVGTQRYYRIFPTFVVTDGFKYLMDEADCYWLANLFGLHLVSIDFNLHPFVVLNFTAMKRGAIVRLEDGNGGVLEQICLDYTDFPFAKFSLFACWSESCWVGMLPNEY